MKHILNYIILYLDLGQHLYFFIIDLGRVPYLGGHYPARAVFRRVRDVVRLKKSVRIFGIAAGETYDNTFVIAPTFPLSQPDPII